eukprot:gene4567-831_t
MHSGLPQVLHQARRDGHIPDLVVLAEHTHPVFTIGRRDSRTHVRWDYSKLTSRGVQVHKVNRGGEVAYHGPGQLMGYFIMHAPTVLKDLPNPPSCGYLRGFANMVEQVVMNSADQFGLSTHSQPDTVGVWAGGEKLAAIGLHFNKYITTFGFGLNVVSDLGFYRGIIPCGEEAGEPTSLELQKVLPNKGDKGMISAMTAVRVALAHTLYPLPIGEISISNLTTHAETAVAIQEAWDE